MPLSTPLIETARVVPITGCGTIDAPWRGWERQVEASAFGPPRTFQFGAGFWASDRPVRLGTAVSITAASPEEGRPWFLPGAQVESLFRIDGVHDVSLRGICLAGRGGRATYGVFVRAGTRIEIRGCRFDDFSGPNDVAVLVSGESTSRFVRGVVIEGSTFLHGATAIRLERDVHDLLVAENRFEEFSGPALAVEPQETQVDYGLIFVKNKIRTTATDRNAPLVRIAAGAQNLRLAENAFEGACREQPRDDAPAAIELTGGGATVARRLELLLNTFAALAGPAIEGGHCGPGLVASGNIVTGAGTARRAAIDLTECYGAVAEDNEIRSARGAAVRLAQCRHARAHGNEIRGAGSAEGPFESGPGLLVEGADSRGVRITDNRVSGTAGAGILVTGGRRLRMVGNEVSDCSEGVHIRAGGSVVVVGNDCRNNANAGIRVDASVRRGFVALNHAILNGQVDLAVHGERMRRRSNKVDHEEAAA